MQNYTKWLVTGSHTVCCNNLCSDLKCVHCNTVLGCSQKMHCVNYVVTLSSKYT